MAGPAATADGHLWVGHNNDLRPEAEADIVAIEKAVRRTSRSILQIGGVAWISVGWNQAGLSLTGNELSPNDERVGISRSHQVFEMLRARNLHEMVAYAIRPDRASSYNNVLADRTATSRTSRAAPPTSRSRISTTTTTSRTRTTT